MLEINGNSLLIIYDEDISPDACKSISEILDIFPSEGFLDSYEREKYTLFYVKNCFLNGKGLFLLYEKKFKYLMEKIISWCFDMKIPVYHVFHGKKPNSFPGTNVNLDKTTFSISSVNNFSKTYRGITVIGDVHGNSTALNSAVNWALSRKNFMIFLGDLVDHGNSNLQTVLTVYQLAISGKAILVLGNHDRKLLKYINHYFHRGKVYISENNKKTIKEFESLGFEAKEEFYVKFKALIANSRTHLHIDNLTFVHGGWHPRMDFYIDQNYLPKDLEEIALLGEKNGTGWKTTYDWLSKIPKNRIVFVGHDTVKSLRPEILKNEHGGQLVKMDLGCGQGGFLASCDLIKKNGLWEIQNFNLHG